MKKVYNVGEKVFYSPDFDEDWAGNYLLAIAQVLEAVTEKGRPRSELEKKFGIEVECNSYKIEILEIICSSFGQKEWRECSVGNKFFVEKHTLSSSLSEDGEVLHDVHKLKFRDEVYVRIAGPEIISEGGGIVVGSIENAPQKGRRMEVVYASNYKPGPSTTVCESFDYDDILLALDQFNRVIWYNKNHFPNKQ